MATDPFLTHEAMDRAHVAAEYFEEHVLNHAFIQGNKKALRLATAIRDDMQALYQMAGSQAIRDRSAFQPAETILAEESSSEGTETPISLGLSEEEYKTLLDKVKSARAYGSPVSFALDTAHAFTLVARGTPADMIILTTHTSYTEAVAFLDRLEVKDPALRRAHRLCRI